VKTAVLWLATLLSVLAVFVGLPSDAWAGPATDVVRAKQTALFELIKKPSTPDNKKKVEGMFDEMLDYAGLAEASLGSEWAARSDAEKAEFSEILKQLVRKAYEKNLQKTVNFNIEYTGEEPASSAVLVKTRAVSKTNAREEPIEINYKMLDKGGAWRVQDIVTEGASLVSSYRTQFTRIIKKDGFPALVKKMKEKLAKGDVGPSK
jgi:phospholipid transport system substrate-binding protein